MAKIYHRFSGEDYITSVEGEKIKFKDFFTLKEVYFIMHEWLQEQGWAPLADDEFKEIFYMHTWTQTAGEEVKFWWRLERIPGGNSYYKYEMDVECKTVGLKTTEAMYQGKKFTTNTGEIEIIVDARIISDYNKSWRNHWLLKNFHPIFYKRIFYKDLDVHKIELQRDMYRFFDMLKAHFKIKSWRAEPEGEQFYSTREFE